MDEFTGGAGDDVFNAVINADGEMTLTVGDVLDGGEGTDRLNVTANGNIDDVFETVNIEQIFVRAVDNDPEIDMTGVDGAEQMWNDRSVAGQTLTFENVQNEVVLGLNDVRAGVTVLNYDLDENATSQTIAANGTRAAHDVSVTGTEAITSATINVTADSEIQLMNAGFSGLTDLTLTGDAELTLTAQNSFANIETVDASEFSSDLTLDISGQTTPNGLESVVTGSGDDTVTVAAAQFAARAAADALTIDLGAGDDTLEIAGALNDTQLAALNFGRVASDRITISGVETLQFAGAVTLANDAVLNTNGLDASALVFGAAVDTTGAVQELTLSGFSGDTITFEGQVGDTSAVTLIAAEIEGELTIVLADDASGAASAFDLVTLAEVTDLTIDATATGEDEDATIATLTAVNLETLTLNLGEGNLEITADLEMENLTTITVTGDADSGEVDFSIDTGVEDLATIDLSGFEGDAVISTANADNLGQNLTVRIGEGDVTYTANDGESREIFQFVGDDIGTISITDFTGGISASADRLDFSQFEGVTGFADLTIAFGGVSTTIDSDAFEGTITVVGVDLTLDANAFIF